MSSQGIGDEGAAASASPSNPTNEELLGAALGITIERIDIAGRLNAILSQILQQDTEEQDTMQGKGKEEQAVEDRELQLLMDFCRKKEYSCSPKYAKKMLVDNGNKIVPALNAIVGDIEQREARLEAGGRISYARDLVLMKSHPIHQNRSREDYLFFMECQDAFLIEFDELGWASSLGQDILAKPEEERPRLYDMEREEVAYRKERVNFQVRAFDACQKSSVGFVGFRLVMKQYDGLIAGYFDPAAPVVEAPGLSGRGYILKGLGYPEGAISTTRGIAKAALNLSDARLSGLLEKLALESTDQSKRAHQGWGLQLNIEGALLQGNSKDADTATMKKMQAELDEEAETVGNLKEAVGLKELEVEARRFQDENRDPKKKSGKAQSKKVRLPEQGSEPSNGTSSKCTKKEDEDSLEAERARALDKLINYDRLTHLHDSLFKSHANIVGETLHSRDDYDIFSAEDVKHFQSKQESTSEDFARTMIALAAGSTALAVALWEDVEPQIRGYLMQKGMAFHEIEQKHLGSEVCRFALHFYHKNFRG